jgi:hypothetical protein
VNVYGGTPPDGGDTKNEKTVAKANPTPDGEVPIDPATTCGMVVVVVVVEVVVDVVCVTLTTPSAWVGDPVQPAAVAASRRTIGNRLRTGI